MDVFWHMSSFLGALNEKRKFGERRFSLIFETFLVFQLFSHICQFVDVLRMNCPKNEQLNMALHKSRSVVYVYYTTLRLLIAFFYGWTYCEDLKA